MYKEERITNENQQKQMENKTKSEKEYGDDSMTCTVSYAKLDLNALRAKKSKIVSSAESLKDIEKINWAEKVLAGEQKVFIESKNK